MALYITDLVYLIEIHTGTSTTNANLAMTDGIIRVVTNNPNYDYLYPQYGPDEISAGTFVDGSYFYEGFLTKNSISNPSRSIDLSKTGNYGNSSSFQFKFTNSNLYWNLLQVANINLINKEVRLFIIVNTDLGQIMYQIWSGKITSLPRTESEFIFNCDDASAGIHKMLPKSVINEVTIPEVYGNQEYVKAVRIGDDQSVIIDEERNTSYVPISKLFVLNDGNGKCNLVMDVLRGSTLVARTDTLNGKYLSFTYSDGLTSYESDKIIRIIKNTSSTTNKPYKTRLDIDYFLNNDIGGNIIWDTVEKEYYINEVSALNIDFTIDDNNYSSNNPYVRIFDPNFDYAINNGSVDLADNKIYTYDENINEYVSFPGEIVNNDDGTFTIITPNISQDGESEFFSPLPFTVSAIYQTTPSFSAGEYTWPGGWANDTPRSQTWLDHLVDKDQRVYDSLGNYYWATGTSAEAFWAIDWELDNPLENIDAIYALADISVSIKRIPVLSELNDTPKNMRISFTTFPYDIYDDDIILFGNDASTVSYDYTFFDATLNRPISGTELSGTSLTASDNVVCCSFNIPTELYDNTIISASSEYKIPELIPMVNNYSDDIVESLPYFYNGGTGSPGWMKDNLKLNDICHNYINTLKHTKFRTYIRIEFEFNNSEGHTAQINFHQFSVFYGNKASLNDNIYLKSLPTSGGTDTSTDTVYGTLKSILETNDEIPSTNIDYGNIELQRGEGSDWNVGRQITVRKNSQNYIKELCQYSYVALFPDRLGKRKFNAWTNNTNETSAWNHDENVIVRDSIGQIGKSPIKDVYNDFVVQYNYNEATSEFTNQMFVTKTDQSVFPNIGSDWTDYVGGVSDYNTAKVLWENARKGYLLTNTVVSNPTDTQQMFWFKDQPTAINYLDELIKWTSVQHLIVDYEIPLSIDNIKIELSDKVLFKDVLLTNNEWFTGYVNDIVYNTKEHKINITLIMNDEEFTPTKTYLIVESGSSSKTYQETGSADISIVEGNE